MGTLKLIGLIICGIHWFSMMIKDDKGYYANHTGGYIVLGILIFYAMAQFPFLFLLYFATVFVWKFVLK